MNELDIALIVLSFLAGMSMQYFIGSFVKHRRDVPPSWENGWK